MTLFFADTSAVAKRYVTEIGSAWVRSWIEPGAGHLVVISDLTKVEMVSVLARRRREGAITAGDFTLLQNAFLLYVDTQYLAIGIQEEVLARARRLLDAHTLRTLDAIQLACALQVAMIFNQPVTLACADQNLLAVATAEGLTPENPNSHP
ncbi:MAG: type II toxin-antitoxin system VapC family toxin [Anaerolineae bacterium]|nr:type II toxin-antitoxin system VapC family toxin [Anaerolineae bacterium]